jgi:NADH:ubiquinone oxidoreductase subunit 4 (subunit M)
MILSSIIFILLLSIFICFFIPNKNIDILRIITLISSAIVFLISSALLVTFQEIVVYKFNHLNLYFSLRLDIISLWFFVLSSLLIFLNVLFIWNASLFKEYAISLLILDLLLLLIFSV